MASVYVDTAYRKQGIGKSLVRRLLKTYTTQGHDPRDLYLLTLEKTIPFYSDLGFHPIKDSVPAEFAFELAAGNIITGFLGETLVVMQGSDEGEASTDDEDR